MLTPHSRDWPGAWHRVGASHTCLCVEVTAVRCPRKAESSLPGRESSRAHSAASWTVLRGPAQRPPSLCCSAYMTASHRADTWAGGRERCAVQGRETGMAGSGPRRKQRCTGRTRTLTKSLLSNLYRIVRKDLGSVSFLYPHGLRSLFRTVKSKGDLRWHKQARVTPVQTGIPRSVMFSRSRPPGSARSHTSFLPLETTVRTDRSPRSQMCSPHIHPL